MTAEPDYWGAPRPEFYVRGGSMFENPAGVPADEIWRFIENNPPEVVAQVIFGRFVEGSGFVFTAELVNQLFDHSQERILGETFFDEERWRQGVLDQRKSFNPNRYACGVDLARKKDHTVITVLDTVHRPARVVYWRRTNRVPWPSIYAEIGRAALHLFPGTCLIDSTGAGDVIKDELEERTYCIRHHRVHSIEATCPNPGCSPRDWRTFVGVIDGFPFSTGSKVNLVNHLQACLGHGYDPNGDPDQSFGIIRCPPIHALEDEMAAYAWDDKKLATDCVFSLALAAYAGLDDQPLAPSVSGLHGVDR